MATSNDDLEKRVAALEHDVRHWLPALAAVEKKDWRRAIGRFQPSELSKQIDAAGQAIREADRQLPES